MSNDDLIQTLAGIPSGSELAESRQFRRAATEHTQGSYQALFRSGTDAFPLAARAAIAAQVADWHRAETLSRHYQTLAVGVE